MYGEYEISGKQFHLAAMIASIEFDQWRYKSDACKQSRLVGVLGEMFAGMYLEGQAGGRSCIPQGLLMRTGLFSANTIDRGDIIMVGKRKVKSGPDFREHMIDAVWTYEVKATSGIRRGLVEARCAREYLSRRVAGVILVGVSFGQHSAHGVIEDIAEPYVIVNDWPLVEVEGKEYFESPLVRRKMDWENSN
ncbi:hypothetical protein [Escherichia phage SECphi4]|nr:hypothetical protein [Escherichia phage SECphi4]